MFIKNLIKHWANLFESEEKIKNGTYDIYEGTNPDGTIDDFSFQRDGEDVFVNSILWLVFRGLGYRDIVDSNGMIEPQSAIRCGMGKIAIMKCQINAVDVSFDKVLNGQKIQEILEDKLKRNIEMNGENNEYYVSRGFDQEFKDAFKKVIHDKIVSSRAGIGPKELPSTFKFEFIDKEEQDYGYDSPLEPTDIVWTIGIEFDEISDEEIRRRELDLVEFGNFKNKKEIDKILSKQFRKNLHKPDLPAESIEEQNINPSDIDMDAIAAPILEKYNSERKPEDTWEYVAEYLEADTFIVNANGLCQTKEAFDRRDEIVYDIAKEIETAANKSAGIDPYDDDTWHCCEHCYWDEDGEEVDDDPDETDWDDDIPIWKKIVTSQEMICCHL